MKLSSGSQNILRAQDLADVIGLIRHNRLTGNSQYLDKSLRPAYRKLVKAIKQEDRVSRPRPNWISSDRSGKDGRETKSGPRISSAGNKDVNEEIDDIDESAEVIPYRYSITYYGADYPVDGLIKRLNAHNIIIPTFDPETDGEGAVEGFQRHFLWTKTQCDRFVESLLLGLPVPGIFLAEQSDGRLLVLDGQQRLRTLQAFYKGALRGQEFILARVQEQYRNRSYQTLDVRRPNTTRREHHSRHDCEAGGTKRRSRQHLSHF